MADGDNVDLCRRLELRRRAWLIRDAAANLVQEHTTIDAHRLQSLLDGIHTDLQQLYSITTEWTDPPEATISRM